MSWFARWLGYRLLRWGAGGIFELELSATCTRCDSIHTVQKLDMFAAIRELI